MFLDQIPKELKRGMLFKLGEQNIFVVKQVFIIQKTNVHLLTDSEETKGFKDTDEDLCIICCVSPKNGALLPCKHNFMCVKCSKGLKICPICRTEIKSVLEIKQ